jgi:hypothetical protein
VHRVSPAQAEGEWETVAALCDDLTARDREQNPLFLALANHDACV